MKLQISSFITISTFSSVAFSGKVSMEQQFQKLLRNVTQNERALDDIFIGQNFDSINYYGCWCTLDPEDLNLGKNHPDNHYETLP